MKIVRKLLKIAVIILVIYIIGKIGYSDMQVEIEDAAITSQIINKE